MSFDYRFLHVLLKTKLIVKMFVIVHKTKERRSLFLKKVKFEAENKLIGFHTSMRLNAR